MYVGVQFQGSLPPNATQRWFTYNWPANWDVVWMVVPTSPQPGAPELEWSVAVERASASMITYWITIHNLTGVTISLEARYAIFNIGAAAFGPAVAAPEAPATPEQDRLEGGSAPALAVPQKEEQREGTQVPAKDAGGPPKERVQAPGQPAKASSKRH
jgi:hypothetical protein